MKLLNIYVDSQRKIKNIKKMEIKLAFRMGILSFILNLPKVLYDHF